MTLMLVVPLWAAVAFTIAVICLGATNVVLVLALRRLEAHEHQIRDLTDRNARLAASLRGARFVRREKPSA